MLMQFVITTAGVMLGVTLATLLLVVITTNKRVLNWYVKKYTAVAIDVADDVYKSLEEKYD